MEDVAIAHNLICEIALFLVLLTLLVEQDNSVKMTAWEKDGEQTRCMCMCTMCLRRNIWNVEASFRKE